MSDYSAGYGEPVSSSYECTPRKISEKEPAGPFGDQTTFVIYNSNLSMQSEDSEATDLKTEYFQRLEIIKSKLASIDIANKHYYNNCFQNLPKGENRCIITEIMDHGIDSKGNVFEYSEEEKDKQPNNDFETDFRFDIFNNYESSSELLELNYNPPKKKPCIRKNTPKIELSGGDVSVSDRVCALSQEEAESQQQIRDQQNEQGTKHIFPDVQVECSVPEEEKSDSKHMYVLFLDTLEESKSPSSFDSINSPTDRKYKKKLFMRSARNKVKPVDSITLWEEIRTMDALAKKKNRTESPSSSTESCFQKVVIHETESEQTSTFDRLPICGLDIPRKGGLTAKFPSITKITKFCSAMFSKKSEDVLDGKTSSSDEANNFHEVANLVLNQRREQGLCLEIEQYTPSCEKFSEYSEQDDDIDGYYQPYCLFCSCL